MPLELNQFKTNYKERTYRDFNALKLWNDSFAKFVSLFLERYLKYKINNRNLCHKLEGMHSGNSLIWVRASADNFSMC